MKLRLPAIRPQTVLTGGALLAPVLLVQVVRMVFSSPGPATAGADVLHPMPNLPGAVAVDPIAAATPKLNAQQQKAVEWLKESRAVTTLVASPFPAANVKPASTVTVTDTQPAPGEAALPAEIKSLTLTSVLRASSGSYATMSGKVVGVGQEIAAGWKVTAIDTEKRMVTLEGPAGRTVYVSQDAPVTAPKSEAPKGAPTPGS